MQKSFVPKETLDLKRVGKWQSIPLKHSVVQDSSHFHSLSHLQQNQPPVAAKVNVPVYNNAYAKRLQEAEALEREIEARRGIHYVPSGNLVAQQLMSPFLSHSRIASIEHEYFPQKHAFLQELHDSSQKSRPKSRDSLSEFNPCPLRSVGLDSNVEFYAGPDFSSSQRPSLHSIIQHWPSSSKDLAAKPKLLSELERSIQSGLQSPQNTSGDFNFDLLALHSDVFDRYIQHTGTYRELLAGIKGMYDRAISFM
jgi:hypothetical protein